MFHLCELLGGVLGPTGRRRRRRRLQRPEIDAAKRPRDKILDVPRPFGYFLRATVHGSANAGPACQADPQRITGGVACVASQEVGPSAVVRSARRIQLGVHGIGCASQGTPLEQLAAGRHRAVLGPPAAGENKFAELARKARRLAGGELFGRFFDCGLQLCVPNFPHESDGSDNRSQKSSIITKTYKVL